MGWKGSSRVYSWTIVVSSTCLYGLRARRARTRSKRCLRALSRFLLLLCPVIVFLLELLQSGRPTPLLVPQHIKIQSIYGDDWQALNESK